MKLNKHYLFPAGLLATLCFAGVAWTQGANLDPAEKEAQFLQPVSIESPYQGLHSGKGSPRSKTADINKKGAKAKSINKSPMGGRHKTVSRSPSLGQYRASPGQSTRSQPGALESAPIGQSLRLSSGSSSPSFLDGYFLKSLHGERTGGRNRKAKETPPDKFQQKSKGDRYKSNNLK